jgi:hypothetical protein
MVMLPALAPTRFIGATPLLLTDRAVSLPTTIEPSPGARPTPDAVRVERGLPRLAVIDPRHAD